MPDAAPTWKNAVHYQRAIWWTLLGLVVLVTGGPTLVAPSALAQSWLPWATTREEPRRPPPRREPPPNYGQFRQPIPGRQGYNSNRSPICLQLEQRLALDAQNQAGAQGNIQRLRAELADARRRFRRADRQLQQRNCYESFLFTRSLRPSRTCHRLDRDARSAERRVEELSLRLRDIRSGGNRGRQDEIIRALARNNCGANYQREARRRDPFTNFWQDNDGDYARGPGNLFGGLPFATYRTVCVRLCDGYYFPVSFSTLPTHFQRDNDVCQSKCAAPTELYFHQNPGGSVDQMVSQSTQRPYTDLRTAFRYRKEYVQGCSCKQSEYLPQSGNSQATAAPVPPTTSSVAKDSKLSPVR